MECDEKELEQQTLQQRSNTSNRLLQQYKHTYNGLPNTNRSLLNHTTNEEAKHICTSISSERERLGNGQLSKKIGVSIFNKSERIESAQLLTGLNRAEKGEIDKKLLSFDQLKPGQGLCKEKRNMRDILLSKGLMLKPQQIQDKRESGPNSLQSFILQRVFKKVKISLLSQAFAIKMIATLQRAKTAYFLSSNKLRNILADKTDSLVLEGISDNEDLRLQYKLQGPNSSSTIKKQCSFPKYYSLLKKLKLKSQYFFHSIPVFEQLSEYRIIWDVIQLISLTFYLVLIPLSICFDYSGDIVQFLIALLFFILLICDVLVNFNTSIFYQGKVLNSRCEIWQYYLQNGFKKDCITLFPLFVFLIANFTIKDIEEENKLIFFSVYWIFYLKFEKFQQFQRNLEVRFHLSPRISQMINLWNLLFLNLYIIHFYACTWIVTSDLEHKYLGSYTWLDKQNIEDNNWLLKYVYGFYFNTVTMVTVGYGDISPQTHLEKLLSIITVLSACGVFAYSISEVGSIFTDMYRGQRLIKHNMYIINNYMKQRRISNQLQHRIRHYLEFYWNESEFSFQKKEQEIVNQLSDNLRESLMIEANKVFILESPILKSNFTLQTLLRTISIAQEQKYTPEEIIFQSGDTESAIYFIEKGSVEVWIEGKNNTEQKSHKNIQSILTQGQFFGQKRRQTFRSLEFTTLLKIDRDQFIMILKENQEDFEQFCQIKDSILLYKSSAYSRQCKLCKSAELTYWQPGNHSENSCPFLHFVPNEEKLQYKFKQQVSQKERARNERNLFKFSNTLYNLHFLQEMQVKYTKNNSSFLQDHYFLAQDAFSEQDFEINKSFSSMDNSEEEKRRVSIEGSYKNKSEESLPSMPILKILKQRKSSLPFAFQQQRKSTLKQNNFMNNPRLSQKLSMKNIFQDENDDKTKRRSSRIPEVMGLSKQISDQQQKHQTKAYTHSQSQQNSEQNQFSNQKINSEKLTKATQLKENKKQYNLAFNFNEVIEDSQEQNQDDFNIKAKRLSSKVSIQRDESKYNLSEYQRDQSKMSWQEQVNIYQLDSFDKIYNFIVYFPHNNCENVIKNLMKKKDSSSSNTKKLILSNAKMNSAGNSPVKPRQKLSIVKRSVLENISLQSLNTKKNKCSKISVNSRSRSKSNSQSQKPESKNLTESLSPLSSVRNHRLIIQQVNDTKRRQYAKTVNKTQEDKKYPLSPSPSPLPTNRIFINQYQSPMDNSQKSMISKNNTIQFVNYSPSITIIQEIKDYRQSNI